MVLARIIRKISSIPAQSQSLQLGGHGLTVIPLGSGPTTSTPAFDTVAGDAMLVFVARGTLADHATATVSDNKGSGNYPTTGSSHNYPAYTTSGSQCYLKTGAGGGSGDIVTCTNPSTGDEVTIIAAEIRGGSVLDASTYNYAAIPSPNVGAAITTSGPALLISFWAGDNGFGELNPGVDSPWQVFEHTSIDTGNHVQAAAAYRYVSSAGTYNIAWTPTTDQGGQVYLFAVK